MKEILNNIINEASSGNVIIDGDSFKVAFSTIIYEKDKEIFRQINNEDYPVLIIKDIDKLTSKLLDYIELALAKNFKFPYFSKDSKKNKIKTLITFLFVNATTEDFINPISLVERKIAFLNDGTFDYLNEGLSIPLEKSFLGSNILIKNTEQSVFMETFNKIEFSLVKEDNNFLLPSITYGIRLNSNMEKEVFIYTILNPKVKETEDIEQIKYTKKISRELYKLNKDVLDSESEEYKDFKNNRSLYYPENISDVSPSALLSLLIFIGLLENENISKIKAVPYLPIRFLSRKLSAQSYPDQEKSEELMNRNIELQTNITDKFIRTFRRASFHLESLIINSYPYEQNEYMEMNLDNINHNINNDILKEVYDSILKQTFTSVIKK